MGFKEPLSLRGKIAFAEGQSHAKLTAPLARVLAAWASVKAPRVVTAEVVFLLSQAVLHLQNAGPRRIDPICADAPCLVFVDGACEDLTSVGGVLVDPLGQSQFFGAVIDADTVHSWKSTVDQVQVIGQAELFPLLVARLTWTAALAHRRVIYFIDNESARIAMIRAYSPVLSSLKIIVQCVGWDYQHQSLAWNARVPTCANIADGPSRMCADDLPNSLMAVAVRPVFPNGCKPASWLK